MDQFVGSDKTLGERTYRKAESKLIASEKTLVAIDRLFREARTKKTGSKKPNPLQIAAIDRWFELRAENSVQVPPVTDEDSTDHEETPLGRVNGFVAEPNLPLTRVESSPNAPLLPANRLFGRGNRFGWALLGVIGTVGAFLVLEHFRARPAFVEEPTFVPPALHSAETNLAQKKRENSTLEKTVTSSKVTPIEHPPPGPSRPATVVNRTIPKPVSKTVSNKTDAVAPAKPPVHETVPYEAEFVSSGPFKTAGFPIVECEPGELREFRIGVKNIGSQPWTRKHRPFSLGILPSLQPTDKDKIGHGPVTVEWMDATGSTENPDLNRVFLNWDEVVGPGETKVFHFKLRLPREPGTYPVTLRMVTDGPDIAAPPSDDGWFAGQTVHVVFKVKDID